MRPTPPTANCPTAADGQPAAASAPAPWVPTLAGAGFMAMAFLGALLVLGMTTLVSAAHAEPAAAAPAPERQRELIHLVRQECGFCHGLRLTGGLGSPLTAQAMREKPAETLEAVILHGIPGTAMPPWRPFLTDADVSWVVRQLQEGFPHETR